MCKDAADSDRVRMPEELTLDYYEVLQISPNADPDTVHRVYRLLAQRFHPDNQSTGDSEKFRTLTEAYQVLGDPEQRAQYDVHRPEQQKERSRLISHAVRAVNDVQGEQLLRLTILELLYARRRTDPQAPGIFYGDLEGLVERRAGDGGVQPRPAVVVDGAQSRGVLGGRGADHRRIMSQ